MDSGEAAPIGEVDSRATFLSCGSLVGGGGTRTLEYADACLKISRAESASSSPRSCGRLATEKGKHMVCHQHLNGHTAMHCLRPASPSIQVTFGPFLPPTPTQIFVLSNVRVGVRQQAIP